MEVSRLDLGSEQRLRLWARLNYVSPDRRSTAWHPVVLAEMRCRDVELGALVDPSPPGARYVPLAPTFLSDAASKPVQAASKPVPNVE